MLATIATLCLLHPCFCLAGSKENQWSAKYLAGSKKTHLGAKLQIIISNKEVVGKQGKNLVLEIPAGSITEVGYDNSSHHRGWALLSAAGGSGGGGDAGVVLVPFLIGAAVMAPFKSTQHFVRILWQEGGAPSEALFEVGKGDYGAILEALQDLTGKPWQNLPEARKKLLNEIEGAKDRSVPLKVDRAVVLNETEMKPGIYRLILLERPENRGEVYFFAGQDVKPERVATQAVVRVEPLQAQTTNSEATYVGQMGVETFVTIQLPGKKLVFDSSGIPTRIARSKRSFYGGMYGGSGLWATVIQTEYKGEPALRFNVFKVIHDRIPLHDPCSEIVYVTGTLVALEIAPNSPQSGCTTFSAPRPEVKAVASQGKSAIPSVEVTAGDKSYTLLPAYEGGNGRSVLSGRGKFRAAAGEWASYFVQAVTDFDAVEAGSKTADGTGDKP